MNVWEQEKQRLWDILIQRVISGEKEVRVRDLQNRGYPETFEALTRLYAERRFRDETPVQIEDATLFDLNDNAVQACLDELKRNMVLTRLLSKKELQEITSSAISLDLDILTRPRQTLLEKLFDSFESQQVSDLLTVLSGFGEERPFIQELMHALEESNTDEISQIDFVTLAADVEKRVYKATPLSAFMTEIDLMLKFEGAITGETHFVVKSDTLLGLLKERGLSEMVEALGDEAESKDFWTPDEIENALERFILVGGFEEGEADVAEPELEAFSEHEEDRQEALDFRLPQSLSVDEKRDANTAHIDFARAPEARSGSMIQFADDSDAETETDVIEEETHPEAVETTDSADNGQIDHAEHDQGNETQPQSRLESGDVTLASLFELIQPDDRQIFLEKIFDDSATEYHGFVRQLDEIETWRDAKDIIEEELKKRDIHPDASEAVRLGEVVFSRYQSINSG